MSTKIKGAKINPCGECEKFMRCKMEVKDELKKMGLHEVFVDFGSVEIMEDLTQAQYQQLKKNLHAKLEMQNNKDALLVERVENLIIEMTYYADELPKEKYSVYISKKLEYNYPYLSNIFSEAKGYSIQQFIMMIRVERVKELLLKEDLNLSEISYKLNYSSVAHLSNQFHKVTGFQPSLFKQLKQKGAKVLKEQKAVFSQSFETLKGNLAQLNNVAYSGARV
ncbi:MAG TPA: helix-turn-helix transcriptional regulator [Bacteroidia bacterium]